MVVSWKIGCSLLWEVNSERIKPRMAARAFGPRVYVRQNNHFKDEDTKWTTQKN